ncbi:hypothetical protein BDR22DRAFT_822271 [Usnea florida]
MGFRLFSRCALISSFAVIASADSNTNGTWLYPDPSTTPTFNYLDTLNASWTSDFSSPWLHLYCGIIDGNSSSPVLGELYNKTAPATGSLDFPLNYALEPFSCHFELSRLPAVGLGPPYALSGNFNVVIESNQKPVTWSQATGNPSQTNINPSGSSSSSTTSEPTTTPSSTSTPSPASTTATTKTPTPTPSSGLSQGAKIGIGVGVALGALALLVAAAGGFFMLRRRRRMSGTGQTRNYNNYATTPQANGPGYAAGKLEWSELPVDRQVHEKDSEPVTATSRIGELEAPRY